MGHQLLFVGGPSRRGLRGPASRVKPGFVPVMDVSTPSSCAAKRTASYEHVRRLAAIRSEHSVKASGLASSQHARAAATRLYLRLQAGHLCLRTAVFLPISLADDFHRRNDTTIHVVVLSHRLYSHDRIRWPSSTPPRRSNPRGEHAGIEVVGTAEARAWVSWPAPPAHYKVQLSNSPCSLPRR